MDILTAILARTQGGVKVDGGYTDTVVLLPKQKLELYTTDEFPGMDVANIGESIFNALGKALLSYPDLEVTVRLIVDKESLPTATRIYKCKPFSGGALGIFIGNALYAGGEDTGEPFLYMASESGDLIGVLEGEVNKYNNSLEMTYDIIHPIKEKYIPQIPASKLPGAVLPVVELTTKPTAEGVLLTEAEAAKMDEVFAWGLPIVGKFFYDSSLQITSIFYHTILGTNNAFTLNAGTLIFTIQKTDDGWVFVGRELE